MAIEHLLSEEELAQVVQYRRRRQLVARATAQLATYHSLATASQHEVSLLADADIGGDRQVIPKKEKPTPPEKPIQDVGYLDDKDEDAPDEELPILEKKMPKNKPKITDEEIDELLARKDYDALIRALMPVIKRTVASMRIIDQGDYERAIADAMVGLWDAAERYDPSKGKFMAFIQKKRLPGAIRDGQRRYYRLARAQKSKKGEDENEKTSEEGTENKKGKERVREIILRSDTYSLDAPMRNNQGEDAGLSLGSTIADAGLTPEQHVVSRELQKRRIALARVAIETLSYRDQVILEKWFAGETLMAISQQFDITETRVSQRIRELKKKLQVAVRQSLRENNQGRLDESWQFDD